MDLTKFSSADLLHLGSLIAKKEELLREVTKIDAELANFSGVQESKSDEHGTSSDLSQSVIAALKRAGRDGLTIIELADRIGRKRSNVSVFLSGTAKRSIPQIQRIGRGLYAWTE